MFDAIGNKLGNVYKMAYTSVMPINQASQFIEKGTLTPEEFIQAGDQLVKACPSWQWKSAIDVQFQNKLFDTNKQYLITTVQSSKRVKDIFNNKASNEKQLEDDWVISESIHKKLDTLNQNKSDLTQQIIQNHYKKDEYNYKGKRSKYQGNGIKYKDNKKMSTFKQNRMKQLEMMSLKQGFIKLVQYMILFISGNDIENNILSQDQIFEDIMSEYANKTVTFETMPYLNQKQASIHPCKHSEALSKIINIMITNGLQIKPYMSLFIFLKFINSIMPTLDFDSTMDVFIS